MSLDQIIDRFKRKITTVLIEIWGPSLLVAVLWSASLWLSLPFATELAIYSIYVLGCNLLYGYLGMVSFGQPVYLSVGAYSTAIYLAYLGHNPLVGILMGVLAGFVVGFALGPPFVRLRGDYFALVNLATCAIGYFVVAKLFIGITGGEDGLWYRARMGVLPILDLRYPNKFFIFALLVALGTLIIYKFLVQSAFGISCLAVKANERKMRFLGYNAFQIKWAGFILASMLSALSGSLFAVNFGFVNPSLGEPIRAGEVLVATLLGGGGTVYGPFFGAFAFLGIKNVVSKYIIARWELYMGILTILVMFRFEKGIWGNIDAIIKERFVGRRADTP